MRTPRSQVPRALSAVVVVAVGALTFGGCSGTGIPGSSASPSGTVGTASPDANGSPSGADTASTSASPGDTSGPATASPESTGTGPTSPESTSTDTASPSAGTATPTGASLPAATCTTVTPVRIEKLSTEPRRTTEVVSVRSDGRNLTPGTREQSEFLVPTLEGPDGTEITDEATMRKIASLISASAKNRVLLARPDAPDAKADANRRPYDAPGTYVVFNSSTPLDADVIVQCSGQEQRWSFTAESDPTIGQVNCAVEPPKSNAVARLVYQNNC